MCRIGWHIGRIKGVQFSGQCKPKPRPNRVQIRCCNKKIAVIVEMANDVSQKPTRIMHVLNDLYCRDKPESCGP
jgi:hypothetical protein